MTNFWNKFKNLIFLKDQEVLFSKYKFKFPNFFWLDISFYDLFNTDKSLFEEKLFIFFEDIYKKLNSNFTTSKVILRSSSLFSEDSKEYFGAGLYSSIVIEKECDFETFKKTIVDIYNSLNNPVAIDFRKKNTIINEKMWIIIQEYFSEDLELILYSRLEYKGFLNSIVKNTTKVMSVSQSGGTIILDKNLVNTLTLEELPRFSYWEEEKYLNMWLLKLPIDTYRIWTLNYLKLSMFCLEVSRIYWSEVQVEYVQSNEEIYIVQIRPFPQDWCIDLQVSFPVNREEICSVPCAFPFEGKELNSSFLDNKYPNRIRYKHSSHTTSMWSESDIELFTDCIPDILFMDTYANADHWHLESLVAERGGIVINWFSLWNKEKESLQSEKQVYVVSDWLYAKFYKVNSVLPLSNERASSFIEYKLSRFLNGSKVKKIWLEDSFIFWLRNEFITEFKNYKLESEDFYNYLFDYIKSSKNFKLHYPEDDESEVTIKVLY